MKPPFFADLQEEPLDRRFEEIFDHREAFEGILKREGIMSFEGFVEYGRNYSHQFANDPNTP